MNELRDVLTEFVEDIDATGGITDNEGFMVPIADPEWIDLATTYQKACRVLGRQPLIDGILQ